MQTSQKHRNPAGIHGFYNHPQEIDQYGLSHIQILENSAFSDVGSQGTSVSFQTYKEEYFTLESSSANAGFVGYDSPAASVSSNRSPFSPQGSNSCLSDPHRSPDNTYGSPMSGVSSADDENALMRQKLRELEFLLLGSESDITNCDFCFHHADQQARWDWTRMEEMIPRLDTRQILFACAQAISDGDISRAAALMHVLEQMVSVSGEPIQRLGAYMLEGLRARVELSGSKIYRALKCEAPVSSDLMTYMGILFKICPYWRFAYTSANVIIREAVEYEPRIHIIDFQIAQGTQWIYLMQALADRPGGPPAIRITGVDDPQSAYARGGGLDIVGKRLSSFAESHNVPFQFHDAAMSGCEVQLEHLCVRPGEAVVVNFPYVLHHMPDESVSTWNHRDRLLRLVKSLSPKVVTLIEQESNTNTKPFLPRFKETLEYYNAMFESIDAGSSRDDKQRINAEQHCVARDIVNMIACEGADRVERHEVFGKWRSRFMMAGFTQHPLSSQVTIAVRDLLKEYDRRYGLQEKDGALYLWWMNTAMSSSSAWR
ncbi:scarecrow-like protein 13 [Ricinus communis]|uniref:Chitin-inducible gibberellin-responsive protein, putative n=1 Tax=Ricinus communis TaxID=3988 RepID=B9T7J9_RICCO|nr:scarecrow-like protein 13 [Ricinus communis]XP_015583872.1 scarecrow-like protein 13 [Ricinus communis]XP_048236102.1 scarecrow-like protein 13 [Ricinus communis]XP_048236103.1 scarecrow-like protein 13 [Ricinus communis]EEF28164.1 Chitin-inducible gibberellin-responsive protein, putative [Ricinus communis]|eukprot:XP_002534218.1 scarecrow-like protein 13 [Ricinus communis]